MATANQAERANSELSASKHSSIEYKTIFFLVLSSFLVVLCLSWLIRKLAHPLTNSADQYRESPIAEARSAAHSSVPYIYSR